MKKILLSISLGLLILILGACTPQSASTTQPKAEEAAVMAEESDDTMMDEEMSDDDTMMDEEMSDDDAMMDEEMSDDDAMMDEEMSDDEMMEDESHDDAMMDEEMSDDDAMMDEESEEAMMDEAAMAELPAWQQISLTNAKTGETFTLADFKGKTIFVEPMATWCTNCRRQFNAVVEAKNQLNRDDVVFIGMSVETSISDADLASYAESNGFDFVWAVMTPELLQELAATFGQSVSNPPATPHFIVRPDGSATELYTGSESAEEIVAQIESNS